MRVISGKWRGRVLKSPHGDSVRPTTDRVKEAIFSILGFRVPDGLFVDLCCGGGGLAIEALSRGAEKVILVDQARKSLDLARANLKLCGAEKGSYELIRSDVVTWLAGWVPPATEWCLVADPPYHSELAWAILRELDRLSLTEGFQLGIVEHGSRDKPGEDEIQEPLPDWESRKYGKSSLAIIRSRKQDGDPDV